MALSAQGAATPVIGISVSEPRAELAATVAALAGRTAALLGVLAPAPAARDQTVVFVHTGGTPALFPYADALAE